MLIERFSHWSAEWVSNAGGVFTFLMSSPVFLTDGVCYQKRIVLSWLCDSHFFAAHPCGSITGSVYPCIYFSSSSEMYNLLSAPFVFMTSHTFVRQTASTAAQNNTILHFWIVSILIISVVLLSVLTCIYVFCFLLYCCNNQISPLAINKGLS